MDGIVHISVQSPKIVCNRPNKTYSLRPYGQLQLKLQLPATIHMTRLLEPSGFLDLVPDPVPDIATDLDLALTPRQVWANGVRGTTGEGGGSNWWVELIRLWARLRPYIIETMHSYTLPM